MSTETSTRPFQVDDRVMVSCTDGEIRPGTVYNFETFPSHPDEATMWVRLDVPYDHNDTCHTVGFVWVSGDHTTVTGPVSLGAHCELIDTDAPPVEAPQDHGPLAAHMSDRTLAKVLSRPAYDPPSPTKDAIVEAAIRWYEIRNAHAADVTPLQLFDADDALNMAVKAHHAAVTS